MLEKVKQKGKELKKKACENKEAIAGYGLLAVGGACTLYVCWKIGKTGMKDRKKVQELDNIMHKIKEEQECYKGWDEDKHRENWDKVNEFVKGLNLLDGEQYYIDGPNVFNNTETIVSHMIDFNGVYPPESE